jgi:uncharacterized protein (DUF2062 family)
MQLRFFSKNNHWFYLPVPRRLLGSPLPTKKGWSRRTQYMINQWIHRLIHLNETPYRIAMGCACGIFCSALPIFGQAFIGMVAARILSASVIASLPWTWISNPLTTLPMWYGGYRLGILILPGKQKPLSHTEIQALMQNFDQMDWTQGVSLLSTEFWEALQPLWLGTVVMGLAMAVPSFVLVYYVAKRLLHRRIRRRQKD